MELNEKLQELRKARGLTQEELAEALFVSRTAISKWESGRGYPSIDSLKAIAAFFSVSIDSLLSCEQVLTIAEADTHRAQRRTHDLVFGLLDCSVAMFFLLPFFAQTVDGTLQSVSLLGLTALQPWLKAVYCTAPLLLILCGVLTLALQNCRHSLWTACKTKLSLTLNALGVLLFIFSPQPYAAAFLFVYLTIKVLLLLKMQ